MSEAARSGIFREVNERIAQIAGAWEWEDAQGFLCECVRGDCTQSVLLTRDQYQAVRAGPFRFFTIPGHERADQDLVVERHHDFVVVEELGFEIRPGPETPGLDRLVEQHDGYVVVDETS